MTTTSRCQCRSADYLPPYTRPKLKTCISQPVHITRLKPLPEFGILPRTNSDNNKMNMNDAKFSNVNDAKFANVNDAKFSNDAKISNIISKREHKISNIPDPLRTYNGVHSLDEIFCSLELQIAWSVSLCDSVFCSMESGSGISDEEPLSPFPADNTSEEHVPCSMTSSDSMTSSTSITSSCDIVMDSELETSFHVWYQPELSREATEELLVKQPLGTFYIRNSSKVNYYALSVHISSSEPQVEHYLVQDKGNVLQMEYSNMEFANFVKLLSFFTHSKTYSATTGIPVQLKIPRLITTSANSTAASVYDQIELEPRQHAQATGMPTVDKIGKKTCEQFVKKPCGHRKSHSPPPRHASRQQQVSSRPKSLQIATQFTFPDAWDPSNCEAPPKPPKPKNYRGNNYNCVEDNDLIYINLDKSPGKMIEVLSPMEQNNLSDGETTIFKCQDHKKCQDHSISVSVTEIDSNKRTRPVMFFTDVNNKNAKNLKLNRRQGPAIFHAPPPPPDEDPPRFIAPSPPNTPPSLESEDEESELSSSVGSLYSSKVSVDQSTESLRVRRPARPVSVMDKVRSRVFKTDRTDRLSVRAKLCHKLSAHILRLTDTRDFTFSARVSTFVTYVKQQHENKPDRLLLQIREFMCNLKHEMISARSDILEEMLYRAQRKGPQPKMNDIIEGVLVKAVIWPLRGYISKVLRDHDESESSQLGNSMTVALSKSLEDLGINKHLFCGQDIDWTIPVQCLQDIPNHYSPIKKLERLLACVNYIYTIIRDVHVDSIGKPRCMGADEFLPLFIYILALSGCATVGQEVVYMQGLLDPPLLIGEPGYYLTTLASSIMLLKTLDFDKDRPPHVLPTVGHLQSMLQIHFTDSDMQQIAYKTLPINQNTTTTDLLDSLAVKFRLDDVADYGLYKVEEGKETELGDQDCPQFIKNQWLVESLERDINSYFTFHRRP